MVFGFSSKYRFAVGTQVLCRTGADEWSAGTIVKMNYREPDWPLGRSVPYQVLLEDGRLIFVPKDHELVCKKLTLPWWAPILDKPAGEFACNPSPQELLQACAGKDINKRNHNAQTALLEAVRLNWLAGVETLIKMQADVNIIDKNKSSALHRACMYAMYGAPMITLLLEAQANPNLQDTDPDYDPEFTSTTFGNRLQHRTPLHYCCLEGEVGTARLLFHGNADLNIQDAQFKAPLHLAIEEDHDAVIDFLLESRADVDLCTLDSGMMNSPLMDAAYAGKHMLAEKLIRARADVNKAGKQDMTALHLATRRGDLNMVKILLEARADPTLESKSGTALNLASKQRSAELHQLFGVKEKDVNLGVKRAPLDDAQRAALYLN